MIKVDKRYVEYDKIPIDYVDRETKMPKRDYVAISKNRKKNPPPKPTLDYHPQEIPGICVRCKTVCTVVFPGVFTFNMGDRIMDKRLIDCVCPVCKGDSQFLPIDFKNANSESFKLVEQMHKKLLDEEINR